MRILQILSKVACLLATALIMLAGLFPPLVFPAKLKETSSPYMRTFTGSRGCLLDEQMTCWIEVQHAAIRPEGFQGTFKELVESEIKFEKVEGGVQQEGDERETITWTSTQGMETEVDTGRLLAEVAFFAGLGFVLAQLACFTTPKPRG